MVNSASIGMLATVNPSDPEGSSLRSDAITMLTRGADARREQFIPDGQPLQLDCPPLNDRTRTVDLVRQTPAKWLRVSIRFSLNT